MSETVSVNFSGPALAFLLYENVKSRCEQEGFLLGETNVIVTKTITDTDSHNVKLHKVININAVVPCPKTCTFYNNIGKLDVEKLENILGPEITNVVAWYKYEPESRFKMSVREKLIHHELSTSGLFPIPTDLFSCCLLSSTTSHLESTNSYKHLFVRCVKNQFINVPLHIANLGEMTNCYKPKLHATKPFAGLCHSVGIPKNGSFDLKLIESIQDKLHLEVGKIMTDLSKSEYIKEQLEQDYQNMKQEYEYYSTLLAEKMMANVKMELEIEKNSPENDLLLSLMDVDTNKLTDLKNDLTKKIKMQKKTELSDTSSDNLIDLTDDEDSPCKPATRPKMSYAQITKN